MSRAGTHAGELNAQVRNGLVGLSVFLASLPVAATDLGEAVITANRTATSVDTTLAATTVITRAQIEALQARSLEDLLRGVDGLNIGNSGGQGKLTSFFVRGTEPEHLLVLVDGIRIGSATAGTAALQNIPIESIERIEFVRGPRSSLYGSEAVGGVLQIFTRRGGDGLHPEFSVSGGSYGHAPGVSRSQRWRPGSLVQRAGQCAVHRWLQLMQRQQHAVRRVLHRGARQGRLSLSLAGAARRCEVRLGHAAGGRSAPRAQPRRIRRHIHQSQPAAAAGGGHRRDADDQRWQSAGTACRSFLGQVQRLP